ncbi:MAG: hypothetical protein A3K67_03305, partial [Euryarchaeota archaeon RBG_16_62_10]
MAVVLVLAAFVPSLIYLAWIRNTERYSREPYSRLLRVFAFGAVFSVLIAVVFEMLLLALFDRNIERVYEVLGNDPSIPALVLACVIAPFVEEATKGLGISRARRFMAEVEDGIVYGAAAGLGFAATENLLYEAEAYLADGAEAFIAVAVVRSLSSALLHAGASSVVGLGIARSARQGKSWLPYYIAGVVMHSAFNFAASFGALYYDDFGESAYLIGLGAAFLLAIAGISFARSKIR